MTCAQVTEVQGDETSVQGVLGGLGGVARTRGCEGFPGRRCDGRKCERKHVSKKELTAYRRDSCASVKTMHTFELINI